MAPDSGFLDQERVDALLRNAEAADAAGPRDFRVLPFRFVQGARIEPSLGDTLRIAQESSVQGLRERLALRLRHKVELSAATPEIVTFSELLLSLGERTAAFSFVAGRDADARALLDWGGPTAFVLVDRLLGGPGKPSPLKRPLTAIEEALLRRLSAELVPILRDAWKELIPIDAGTVRFEARPEGSRLAAPGDRFLVTLFRLRLGSFHGSITLALRESEVVKDGGASPEAAAEGAKAPATAASAPHGTILLDSRATLSVQIPALRLRLGEVAALDSGRTIDTSHPIDGPLPVFVNGRHLLNATLGQSQGRYALRVVGRPTSPSGPGRASNPRQGRLL